MGTFEKYLSLWVLLCIVVGIALGYAFQEKIQVLSEWEFYGVNIPITLLIWAMIYPMMVQIDFSSLRKVGQQKRGLTWTIIINWLIKPFTMALFAWVFFEYIYGAWLSPELANEYIAGAIILGAAPCTAMVFVWSYLSQGDPNYTVVQVSINDIIILIAFIPIVQFLLGITSITVPFNILLSSVVAFVVIPLLAGYLTHLYFIRNKGKEWMEKKFLPRLKPWSIIALLSTLILIFAFQGDQIVAQPLHIVLIAIPLSLQTYFIFFLAWKGGRWLGLPYTICAPSAMIGSSNFFELAVAVAIVLFGINSGAVLATVVGVLIEVPIMLSLVQLAKRWKY
jgi:ACR3 family arsenite transporter